VTNGCIAEWMPSAPITTSASATAPFSNVTRAFSASCANDTARCPAWTRLPGTARRSTSTRSARCMPYIAAQPEESVVMTGATLVPSWR
jgi:hypothetical protein